MTTPLLTLTLFISWTLLLVFVVVIWRTYEVLSGKVKTGDHTSGIKHGSELYWRLNRAHINAIETLPIFAALVLVAHLTQTAGIDLACWAVIGGRVAQSILHISSEAALVIQARFTGFLVQLIGMAFIAVQLLTS